MDASIGRYTETRGAHSHLADRFQAKYHKLAYSAQFGFSLPSGSHGLMGLAPDSTLVLRDLDQAAPNDISDQRWIARDHVDAYEVRHGGVVWSVWKPFGTFLLGLIPDSEPSSLVY